MATHLPSFRILLFSAAACALSAQPGGGDDALTQLPDLHVGGERIAAIELSVPRAELRAPGPNLGKELLTVPGVFGHARAPDAWEPNIRGLAFDRVATSLNGLPLLNASPERTNSPVAMLGGSAVTLIAVTKSLASVTQGPVTTGGRVDLVTDEGAQPVEDGSSGLLRTTYFGGRDGVGTAGQFSHRSGPLAARVTLFANRLGDYTGADGRTVAARLEDQGGSVALGWHTAQQRARLDVLTRRLRRQDNIALPLDARDTGSEIVTYQHRWTPESARALRAVQWRAGYAFTDPYITSELRSAPSLTRAIASARSLGSGLLTRWDAGAAGAWDVGADYSRQTRRAVRTTATGQDHIWPGIRYTTAGAFAEWKRPLAEVLRLRVGARLDEVRSDAKDADRTALGRPLREQYIRYNGAAASVVRRRDAAGAVNALFQWRSGETWSAFAGAGYSEQPAQTMERYRAFLNALGGDGRGGNAVELGNPALRSERSTTFEAGGAWHGPRVDVEVTAYAYRIQDYIHRLPIGTTAPPIAPMVVFGYRNLDASFSGAEAAATLKPAERWSVPMTFAVARGTNRTAQRELPEVPPWDATAAVRYRGSLHRAPLVFQLGTRVVGAKQNPAPSENPLFRSTGGFAVWHARVALVPRPDVKLEAGFENLFERRYSEYLMPPVAPLRPASGTLKPGERIPAPGRSFWASLTLTW